MRFIISEKCSFINKVIIICLFCGLAAYWDIVQARALGFAPTEYFSFVTVCRTQGWFRRLASLPVMTSTLLNFCRKIQRAPLRMNALEEINKELEAKTKKLEEDILSVIEYNNRLRSELEELRREERLTLSWLTTYSVKEG